MRSRTPRRKRTQRRTPRRTRRKSRHKSRRTRRTAGRTRRRSRRTRRRSRVHRGGGDKERCEKYRLYQDFMEYKTQIETLNKEKRLKESVINEHMSRLEIKKNELERVEQRLKDYIEPSCVCISGAGEYTHCPSCNDTEKESLISEKKSLEASIVNLQKYLKKLQKNLKEIPEEIDKIVSLGHSKLWNSMQKYPLTEVFREMQDMKDSGKFEDYELENVLLCGPSAE